MLKLKEKIKKIQEEILMKNIDSPPKNRSNNPILQEIYIFFQKIEKNSEKVTKNLNLKIYR